MANQLHISQCYYHVQHLAKLCFHRYCRGTIFNDPWTALGSHIKGPNNMIYREWAWQVWPWAQVIVLVVVPTGNTAWASLAGLTKPSISQSSKTQAPSNFVFFSFYTGVPFPFLRSRVNFTFWGVGLSSRPIPRVVGGCWKSTRAWVWVWACQTQNSVLLCWRFFPLLCPYTQFASFFWHLVKCRAGGHPRQWLSSARALDPNVEWAWAANHLAPQ